MIHNLWIILNINYGGATTKSALAIDWYNSLVTSSKMDICWNVSILLHNNNFIFISCLIVIVTYHYDWFILIDFSLSIFVDFVDLLIFHCF